MADFANSEARFKMLAKSKPELAAQYLEQAQRDADARWNLYSQLAALSYATDEQKELAGATS